jgi:multiple sugar transport system substrate-binding protein
VAGVQLRRARTGVVLAITCLLLLSACGGGDDSSSGQSQGASGDTGATITMWTRVATQDASKRLVERYNATHKNKVELTPIPTDNYQPRIAAAAGAKNLPDVFAADVIFMPQYTSKGCSWTSPTGSTRCRSRTTWRRRTSSSAPSRAASTASRTPWTCR